VTTITYKKYIPIVLLVFLVITSFLILKPLLLSILLGALFAFISYPLYKIVKRKREILPALFVCIFVLAILVVPTGFFIKFLVKESFALFLLVKQKLAVGLFQNCTNQFCLYFQEAGTTPAIQYQIQEISKAITNTIISKGSAFLLSVPLIMLNLFVIFFTMFYFLKDGHRFIEQLPRFLGIQTEKFVHIMQRLQEITHGLVYGYFLVALVQGALGAIGFFIFGVPSPLFWGLVMALFALIPLLGTGLVWVPASLILFLNGVFQDSSGLMLKGILLFGYSFIFVGFADNLLRPKLIGKKAKIHPAIILLGIFGGVFLFGALGVIIGPVVLALTSVFFTMYVVKEEIDIKNNF